MLFPSRGVTFFLSFNIAYRVEKEPHSCEPLIRVGKFKIWRKMGGILLVCWLEEEWGCILLLNYISTWGWVMVI